ncbi:MAG: hypothetical protein LBU35_00125 [Holosporales bacterium]|jgi:hypothetical protein|nr:hypothetical protein [Holosporales bacterium]
MKIIFSVFLIIIGLVGKAMAVPVEGYDGHMTQVRARNPGIDNTILRDGSHYVDTIREIKNIIANDGAINYPIPTDLNVLTDAYWNLIVFSDYITKIEVDEEIECNAAGIDNLHDGLVATWGFENKINSAIEDVKRHCAFINLYPLLERVKKRHSFEQHMGDLPEQGWKADRVESRNYNNVMCELTLQNHGCSRTLLPYLDREENRMRNFSRCNEVRAHPYNGYDQLGRDEFNARIPIDDLRENIINDLSTDQLGQDFIITVESPLLIGPDLGEIALKPQWAFYNGGDVHGNVECFVKVYKAGHPTPDMVHFPLQEVSLHDGGVVGQMVASNDSHPLGFSRDNENRALLYSVLYSNPIAGTTKTGLIFIFSNAAYTCWEFLRQWPISISQILQIMYIWGYVHADVMQLLGIPVP